MNIRSFFFPVAISLLILSSCKKDPKPGEPLYTNEELQIKILEDFGDVIARPIYSDMELKMTSFYDASMALSLTQDISHLDAAKQSWRDVRAVWEQSEAFLFGPVSTNNIDHSTDTSPVDHNALEALLAGSEPFTQDYINSLGDGLKGYHAAEYLLWGENGNKSPQDFTTRELEFLSALVTDLKSKVSSLVISWDPAIEGNYSAQLIFAGTDSSVYVTQRAAFEEIINAIAGICDEVANGKISEPFVLLDPSLEESPYSQNSISDFRNNIIGVKNVFFGRYTQEGFGLNDFLDQNNKFLSNKIGLQIDNAINSFSGVTDPFGDAIFTQPAQVQHVIDQLNILRTTLEDELYPYMQQTIVN